jgi:hypothetical protein
LNSRASIAQSGSLRRRKSAFTPERANSRCSRTSSVSSGGNGQPIPLACARRRLSWIVLRATPNVRPISRALTPS